MTRLVFITLSNATYRVFHEQLESFFGGNVDIQGLCLEDDPFAHDIRADLWVASSRDALSLVAAKRFDWQAAPHVIVSRRTLNPSKLSPLFGISPETRVLVVNNAEDVAVEAVEILKRYGLSHLDLVPWWPGAGRNANGARVAVTPGFPNLVPKSIPEVHDLGIRPLDVSTLVEIGLRLGLSLDDVHYATATQFKDVVEVVRTQTDLVKALESFGNDLEAILDSVLDGVVLFDEEGIVLRANSVAKSMLGTDNPVGSKVTEWFSDSFTGNKGAIRAAEGSTGRANPSS